MGDVGALGQLASRLGRGWPRTSANVWVGVGVVFILCAIPPATNVSPGPWGYALVLVALSVLGLWLWSRAPASVPLSRSEVVAGVVLFGWMVASVPRAADLWAEALVATVLASVAAASAWVVAARVSREGLVVTVILCSGAALAGSVVAAWVIPLVGAGGWSLRPGLPIGGASNNAVGLVLIMAGSLAGARRWPAHRVAWWALTACGALLVAQSVSRAGWVLVLALLLALVSLQRRWVWQRVAALGVPLAVIALFVLVQFRGRSALIDTARWDNAAVGLDAWWTSPATALFGIGPMSLWPWLPLERRWSGAGSAGTTLYESPWGPVLYHAHSTFTAALVEYGTVGFVALLVVLGFVTRRCIREIRGRGDLTLVAVAVLLALPAMLVELYLFRSFVSAFLWWLAVMAVGRGPGDEAHRKHADEGAAGSDDRHRAGDVQAGGEDLNAQPEESHRGEGPGQVEHFAR